MVPRRGPLGQRATVGLVHYLDNLNEAQKQAVLATDGPVSVLAGAGAGKTKVLTTRIYHLIRSGVPANRILAVTFTNKAAREMRERVQKMLGAETYAEKPLIATFHGLGRELLESYGSAIGVPRYFSVFDRDDSEKAVGRALKELGVETKELSPRAVLSKISRAKGAGQNRVAFAEKYGRTSYGNRIASEAWRLYEAELRREKALDFDDLIALPVRLLLEHPDIRKTAEERWSHVHIDEYQDTNALQGELTHLLAGRHRNLFVVGDIDQTVYVWRGATIENLLEFDQTYPEAKTIVLEHNYRSTKTIVEAANRVIELNKKRKEKRSVTDNAVGEPILLHEAVNAELEARYVADKIKSLMRSGTRAEDVAVLFRTNFQSRALEEALLRAGVPYRLLGTRFFERKEVKDVLAWVRLALEPSRETDKIRAAQAPSRGIGKTTLAKLAAGKRDDLRAGERSKVQRFEETVRELTLLADTVPASEFLRLTIEKSGMRTALEEGSDEERERFGNIQELATLAARHDALPGREGIATFLAESALASDQDTLDHPPGSGEEKRGVTLMTVHAAKGLEFETVFVTGMEEGLFPHEDMGGDTDRDEEEERRLFYVAMTRAKARLILTFARIRKIYGTDFLQDPSSFLADLDPSLVKFEEAGHEHIIEV